MPSTEANVGEIQGYEPNEFFDVSVETDADNTAPKYVYVRRRIGGAVETSFYFGNPPHNCPLSRAAAIVAGSLGHYEKVMSETAIENMDEVIDWEDTANMWNGGKRPSQTDWSQPPNQ